MKSAVSLVISTCMKSYACVRECPARLYVCTAVVDLCDSSGFTSPRHLAAAQPPVLRGTEHATLLDAFHNDLSSSQFAQLYGFDPASLPLLSPQQLQLTGIRSDLPAVAEEEKVDEEMQHGTFASRDGGEYDERSEHEDNVHGRMYSCDHCHCSVCKRSLEHHECQRSAYSSEHEVLTDDAGGSVAQSLVSYPFHLLSAVRCCFFCYKICYFVMSFFTFLCYILAVYNLLLLLILSMLTMSVGIGRTFKTVCLFVRSITQKRIILRCSTLV